MTERELTELMLALDPHEPFMEPVVVRIVNVLRGLGEERRRAERLQHVDALGFPFNLSP